MKIKMVLLLCWFSVVNLLYPLKTEAQNVCVIGEKKLAKLEGLVTQVDKQLISDALVRVFKKNVEGKLMAETKTDKSGYFVVPNLARGKYIVSIRYPNFVKLVFPIRLSSKEMLGSQKLTVVLGWDYDEPCGGGEVSISH